MLRSGRVRVALVYSLGTLAGLLAAGDRSASPARSDERQPEKAAGERVMPLGLGAGRVAFVDPETGAVAVSSFRSILKGIGNEPGPAIFAECRASDETALVDPWFPRVSVVSGRFSAGKSPSTAGAQVRQFDVVPNPQAVAFSADGRWLAVASDPPGMRDRSIDFIELATGAVNRRSLPECSNLRGIALDPRGKFALAVHLVPKSNLPATQIEQGWVFTNAISHVPFDRAERVVTLPLDLRTRGFANPEGVAIAADGKRAYVSHAGADLVSVIDLPAFLAVVKSMTARTADRSEPPGAYRADDLQLTRRYVRSRIPVGANPRGIAISADGAFVAVANRLDDSISLIDTAANSVVRTIPVPGGASINHLVRQGEKLFHSGALSFSGQFSCASCHPDGHVDGLNWDLPADGFNNFHNTKTLLGTAGTAPYGWGGTSADVHARFAGTLRFLFQHEPTAEESAALEAYLAQLDYPAGLPHRVDPESAAARRGRALFLGAGRCAECHSGPKFTDRKTHDIGAGAGLDPRIDTPSLVRVSETPPYLHDGRAETLLEIFTRHNPAGEHGGAVDLSAEQLADLIEYLKSL